MTVKNVALKESPYMLETHVEVVMGEITRYLRIILNTPAEVKAVETSEETEVSPELPGLQWPAGSLGLLMLFLLLLWELEIVHDKGKIM